MARGDGVGEIFVALQIGGVEGEDDVGALWLFI